MGPVEMKLEFGRDLGQAARICRRLPLNQEQRRDDAKPNARSLALRLLMEKRLGISGRL
jgi:hypothetical protein